MNDPLVRALTGVAEFAEAAETAFAEFSNVVLDALVAVYRAHPEIMPLSVADGERRDEC